MTEAGVIFEVKQRSLFRLGEMALLDAKRQVKLNLEVGHVALYLQMDCFRL